MGHLGLTLQAVAALGGYKVQANSVEQATMLRKDAKRCEAAGVLCVVECIPYQLEEKVSAQLSIPVIEIGSDPKIDGQVIIFHDLDTFGVDCVPKFANVNRKVMLGLIDLCSRGESRHLSRT